MADSKKNIIFNAEIDNELLHLMQEQVMQGRRAHRGFKNEAYVAVAKVLSSSDKFNGLQFSTTIVVNRCRKLKDSFMAVTELLNAYGFGFDNTTKRVVASGEVWKNWEQSHPKARAWQSRTIDYENMCFVWGNDSAIGQFSQPSSSAYSDMDENSIGGLPASLGDDINLDIDDVMEDFSNGESRGESTKSRSGKRVKDNDELAMYFRESTEVLRLAIVDAADAIRNPKNNSDVRTNAVVEALESIEELTAEEVDMAHEWLVARKNMTTTFLSARNKVDWISRRMSSIRNDTMFGS